MKKRNRKKIKRQTKYVCLPGTFKFRCFVLSFCVLFTILTAFVLFQLLFQWIANRVNYMTFLRKTILGKAILFLMPVLSFLCHGISFPFGNVNKGYGNFFFLFCCLTICYIYVILCQRTEKENYDLKKNNLIF